ncbi:MAG: glycosyltransferase [bacterium]
MREGDAAIFDGKMKVALVHDYLIRLGGAERVLLKLHEIFPEAPIYTLLYDEEKMGGVLAGADIRPSFLQKLPKFIRRRQKHLLPFLPVAAETFDLREFDLVISSSSAFAKSIITRPGTTHICYCHAPSRFLWDWNKQYIREQDFGPVRRALATLVVHYLRIWDKSSSRRPDYFIANSRATREKIQKYYRRNAFIIYPPVCLPTFGQFRTAKDENYFLIVSQLTPYKRIDLAIEAFNRLKLLLLIIGDGPEREKLEELAGPTIKFLGERNEEEKNKYLKNCTAFVFAGEDDFGIAPVEAMGWGKPVLAFGRGGALETIIPGVTGEFFYDAVPEILADGVRRLRENLTNYSPLVIHKRAEKFSEERFRRELIDFLKKVGYNI